ncbi:MAG: hypothetical protein K6F26_03065 [Lachnospiraceae bacterium]|nr:hypothetical protein [Lachnospiraceae bacterium]
MRKGIKRRLSLLMLFCAFFCLSCNKREKKTTEENGKTVFAGFSDTCTETYVIYQDNYHTGQFRFFDVTTGQAGPFCFNPTCEHKRELRSYTGEILREGCVAYSFGLSPLFLYGNYAYYYNPPSLYRTDRQGNNRECICTLSRPYEVTASAGCFTEEAYYMPYILSYEYELVENNNGEAEWRAGKLKEKSEFGILRIPYSGGPEQVIFRSDEYYDMAPDSIYFRDGHVCFSVNGMDRPNDNPYNDLNEDGTPKTMQQVVADPNFQSRIEDNMNHTLLAAYDYNISSGEVTELFRNRVRCAAAFRESSYVVFDSRTKTVELYHYDGTKIANARVKMDGAISSDRNYIGWEYNSSDIVMLDEKTGQEINRVHYENRLFSLYAAVGKSYYGHVSDEEGTRWFYISEENLWNGDTDKIVIFPGQTRDEETE